MDKPKVIAIVGPTASGKSALGVFLAKKLQGEVISADSRQVYRGLDIAAGKITTKEMQGIPHYLLDVASPRGQFTVDDFVKKGGAALKTIERKKKIPIIVGGTGLYVDALLGRLALPNVPPNPALRAMLEKKTAAQLFAKLARRDPRRAATIERGNKRRLIRALEIAQALGHSPSAAEAWRTSPYDILWLGLDPGDKKLASNIRARVNARMRAGMIAEATRLHAQGLSYKRMEELGLEYRYLAHYLQKQISKTELETAIERGNRAYAKRQMRWFKRNKDTNWVKGHKAALALTKKFLTKEL